MQIEVGHRAILRNVPAVTLRKTAITRQKWLD
jgi:hypothetical protein